MYLQDIFIFYHHEYPIQPMTLQPVHQKRLFFPDPVRPDPERTNSKQSKYCRQDQKIDQTSPDTSPPLIGTPESLYGIT